MVCSSLLLPYALFLPLSREFIPSTYYQTVSSYLLLLGGFVPSSYLNLVRLFLLLPDSLFIIPADRLLSYSFLLYPIAR
jgi:hypothetical protein